MNQRYSRIGKKVNLKDLSITICKTYMIGIYKKHQIISVGIDDLSFFLWTDNGKYIVKTLNTDKTLKHINDYIKKYEIIMQNNIKAPKLILNRDRHIFISEIDGVYLNLCLLEYINGKDLYTLNKKITKEDIDKLVNILRNLHSIKSDLEIEYDEYCFMSLKETFSKCKSVLSDSLTHDITTFIKKHNKINFDNLPKCYVHGDLIQTNIVKDKSNELWLIDFDSSGYGYRILDIVKILSGVIFNYKWPKYSVKMQEYFLQEYCKCISLTDYELDCLDILRKADSYVGLMLLEYHKELNNGAEETFWIKNDTKILELLSNI